jgi:hypothetical protein
VHGRKWSGDWVCVGRDFLGSEANDPPPKKSIYDWQLGHRAAFELNTLSNRYGLNQFDILGGMVPWLIACQKEGAQRGGPVIWEDSEGNPRADLEINAAHVQFLDSARARKQNPPAEESSKTDTPAGADEEYFF